MQRRSEQRIADWTDDCSPSCAAFCMSLSKQSWLASSAGEKEISFSGSGTEIAADVGNFSASVE